jgi:Ribonuclease G/E
VEDDQLAEVYLERENEYTLAGSIYKGRVTRVLPGMQSAFVDIGLERDAFLYVSDFMELENQEDDLDEIPATPVIMESGPPESSGRAEATFSSGDSGSRDEAAETEQPEARADASTPEQRPEQREDRGGYRNRRRRRGRRDGRGPAPVAESRYSRPAEVQAVTEREQYGPPPGYQPIILPGESISKYRNAPHPVPVSQAGSRGLSSNSEPAGSSVASTFPNDEPIFAQPGHETEDAEGLPFPSEQLEYAGDVSHSSSPEAGTREWERSQERLQEMKVAAVFGGEEAME